MPNPSTIAASDELKGGSVCQSVAEGGTKSEAAFAGRVQQLLTLVRSAAAFLADSKEVVKEARKNYNAAQKDLACFIDSYSKATLPLFECSEEAPVGQEVMDAVRCVVLPESWRSTLISSLGLRDEIERKIEEHVLSRTVGGLFDYLTHWDCLVDGQNTNWIHLMDDARLSESDVRRIINKLDMVPGFNQAYEEAWEQFKEKHNDDNDYAEANQGEEWSGAKKHPGLLR